TSPFEKGLSRPRRRGLMLTFGNASGVVPLVARLARMTNGSLFLTRPTLWDYVATREELLARAVDLFQWIPEGRLDVRIGGRDRLDEVARAELELASRETTGKLIIVP